MTYSQIIRRIARARETEAKAIKGAMDARRQLDVWGIERFVSALEKRGIVKNETLIMAPGRPGQRYPFKSVCPPCAARFSHIGVDAKTMKRGALGKNRTCSSEWWTFRITMQRKKKDGGFREEGIVLYVHGDTPEAAAKQVQKWGIS